MRAALIAVAAGAAVLLVMRNRAAAGLDMGGQVVEVQQDSGGGWTIDNVIEEARAAVLPDDEGQTMSADNRAAFLLAIRYAEGTAGPNGYRTMFGGQLFSSYDDHPRRAVQFTDKAGRRLWTSAAGAYQFMAISPIPGGSTRVDTWDRLKRKGGLVDFSPESQDRAALMLVDECGALADVDAGRFDVAIGKCRRVWASLPGAGYAQPERSLSWLRDRYTDNGGRLA